MVSNKAINAAIYSSPDLVPPNKRPIALVISASPSQSLLPVRFTSGIPASPEVGIIIYKPGDVIPDNILKATLQAFYSGTPTAPVPSLGAELVTNGNMELDANWQDQGAPTTNARSAVQAHGGTYSRYILAPGSNQGIVQSINTTIGQWIKATGWVWVVSGSVDFRGDSNIYVQNVSITGSWQSCLRTWRANGVSHNCLVTSNGAAEFYADDLSWQPITLSSCLTIAADPGTRYGIVDSAPTLTTGTQCGHWIWVDNEANPLYGVLAYHNGTNAILEKCVNGVYTQLVSVVATYSAGAQCRTVAVLDGTTPKVGLYYNGTLIGSIQSITDAGFGTKVCGFSTLAGNTPGQINIMTGVGV